MPERNQFLPGQTVSVLTNDGFLFVGQIVCCDSPFECGPCDTPTLGVFPGFQGGKGIVNPLRFLVLELEEEVETGGPPGPSVVAFVEGRLVFINFDQIIAISPGFPPTKK